MHKVIRVTLSLLYLVAGTAGAQAGSQEPSSRCWRFAFGAWTPPLDWSTAGHDGRATDLATRVQRVRDSVFARDTNAVRNNAMVWERTPSGWSVVLFPQWWPVGVQVEFDSVFAGGAEMTGRATALVADASSPPSRTRARALRCP
jgi:hypothetical protein